LRVALSPLALCRPQRDAPGCTASRRALLASAQAEKKARLRERERERKKRAAERKIAAEAEAGVRASAEVAAAAAAAAEQAGRCASGCPRACWEGAGALDRCTVARPVPGIVRCSHGCWDLAARALASCELH